jgi:hypothetical protein
VLILVSGATKTLRELDHADLGHFIVPHARNRSTSLPLLGKPWAGDNGCFKAFDPYAFERMLQYFRPYQDQCLFITAPDRVGDAATTLQWFPLWSLILRQHYGYKVALVAQDGLTVPTVPWATLDALFIGGTTAFKESREAATLGAYAKARGKWLHMGRVNTKRRLKLALAMGCDSLDGSGFSKWPGVNLPLVLRWIRELQP